MGLNPHILIDLNLIFEISSLKNQVGTGFLQATQAVKIQFKIDKKSSLLNLMFQARDFKNRVDINKGPGFHIKRFIQPI